METSSFIFPLNPSYETWGKDRKLSTEFETGSVKKFSSSSMLLEAPRVHYKMRKPDHMKKKGDHGDTSSGYLNFGDVQSSSEGVLILNQNRSSVLSAEELALESLVSNPSFREKTCSPVSHILSISSGDEEEDSGIKDQDSSCHPTNPGEDELRVIVEASNPAFELDSENTRAPDDSEDGRYSVNADPELSPPVPPSAEHDHQQDQDSGFPMSDSGCPLSAEDCSSELGSSDFLTEHEEAVATNSALTPKCHVPNEDSGFPFADSSSPLLPAGKNRSAQAMASEATDDSGYPMMEIDNQLKV